MTAQSLIQHANYGLNRAASRIGVPYNQYRAGSASNPVSAAYLVGTITAAFTPHGGSDYDFGRVADYRSPLYHLLSDPTTLLVGDYLQPSTGGTPFFVAISSPPAPVLAVACNRVVTLSSPGASTVVGAGGYGGSDFANDQPFLSGWPACLLMEGRGVHDQSLPEDSGYGNFQILLPWYQGTVIRPGSILTDDLGNRFDVQSAELQSLGWRLSALQAVT